MLPLILAAGSSILSAKNAQDQKKDLRRQSDMDALIQSGQTAYSGFRGGPAGQFSAGEGGPSVLGNALSGGIAGFSQGQGFQTANAQNAYSDILRQQMQQQQQPQGKMPNAYSGLQGSLGLPAKQRIGV